jgi:uncharacterized membrane protein
VALIGAVRADRVLWAAMALWAGGFAALAGLRHVEFLSGRFDLGNMTQALWSTAHGRFLETTTGPGIQSSRLGSHVDPLLALLTPGWLVWPSPLMLVTVQAIALALGALPVFWLARKHLGDEKTALKLAAAYLLYPAVGWSSLNDFHPVAFAIPLLLFAIWFLDEDRLLAFAVVAVLAASSKEEIPLVIAGLGVWYGVRSRRIVPASAIVSLGVAWTAVAIWVVVPHFRGAASPYFANYEEIGGSLSGSLTMLAEHPGRLFAHLVESKDITYLIALSAPLLGCFLLSPLLALAAAPVLALNLLSSGGATTSVHFQYVSGIVPCLVGATVLGVARLGPKRSRTAASFVLLTVIVFACIGPITSLHTSLEQTKSDAIRAGLSFIPPDAPVAASNRIGAHLSERRQVYSVPVWSSADWVIADRADPWMPVPSQRRDPRAYDALLAGIALDPAWHRVFDREGIVVYRRVAAGSAFASAG